MSIGALAPVVARLDELFRVVPRAASGGHGDGNEQASDDGTDEQASERVHAKAKAHDDRCKHGEQGRRHHLADRFPGDDVDRTSVVGLARAVHDARDFPELAAHFFYHRAGGLSDRFHGHGREEVGNETAEEQAGDHIRVGKVEVDRSSRGFDRVDEVAKQHERREAGRTDGIGLGDRLGRVADRVERIRNVADRVWQAGHLGDASGVVRDRTVCVNRDDDPREREHGHGRDGDAVEPAERLRGKNTRDDDEHWERRGLHREPEARNDVGAVSRLGCLRELLDRGVLRAGVVFRDPDERARDGEPDQRAVIDVGVVDALDVHPVEAARDEPEPDGRKRPRGNESLIKRAHDVL